MTWSVKAYRTVLLGFFLTISHVYGEEVRGSGAAEARAALAASIPRRESELALLQREDVLAQVEQRIGDMALSASADELTDLLQRREHLAISIDKCGLGIIKAGCRALKAELAAVEAIFREKTGLSTREFRSGRLDTPNMLAATSGVSAQASGDTCNCTFQLYTLDRWMNRYWGLECGGHASHGVCSNNVDTFWHSPGSGAMVGDISLYFGASNIFKQVGDDHLTMFHGPSTSNQGEWGNVCNCDTEHTGYYNPYGPMYGGDLTDSRRVWQLGTGTLSAPGACNEVSVYVREYVEENDPNCCNDRMGTLFVSLPLADGVGTTSGLASAQNCSGGSQSGVSPYCGTFGATLQVVYNCATNGPPPPTCDDPQREAACWDSGGIWNSSMCMCGPGCTPGPMMFNGVIMPLPPPC